ncbi:hypothetical protein GCM10022403_024750 [Streptomyces coacervatus]|uniref:Uncharacterized protein n=1 Tax=Streptomyces coacervatus TaxID=647381 RepID=A0ABP7HI01_9ACTN
MSLAGRAGRRVFLLGVRGSSPGKCSTDRQVIEIVTTTGYYVMLAGLMNGLGVDVDPSGEQFLGLVGGDSG